MEENQILFSWLGHTDIQRSLGTLPEGDGPLGQALRKGAFPKLVLLNAYRKEDGEKYLEWANRELPTFESRILITLPLTRPTDHGEIFNAAMTVLDEHAKSPDTQCHFLISPGTPAMVSIWMFISLWQRRAILWESSREEGLRRVELPTAMVPRNLAEWARRSGESIQKRQERPESVQTRFDDILHRDESMARLIERAKIVSAVDVPVLLEGESGTGKELLARAIHHQSPRREGPFVAVNCGAIPQELMESEFFGHRKGSFTGAIADKRGHFEAADGGTLFLDEIGEMPMALQVKLLRVIQENRITPVGDTREKAVDIRLVCATNRTLLRDVEEKRFRLDLYYRICTAILKIPALHQRPLDLPLLAAHFLDEIHGRFRNDLGFVAKRLDPSALALLATLRLPGNIRELYSLLVRVFLWCPGPVINAEHIKGNLITGALPEEAREKSGPTDLESLLEDTEKRLVLEALESCKGNKTRAAQYLSLNSYQSLDVKMKKYGIQYPPMP